MQIIHDDQNLIPLACQDRNTISKLCSGNSAGIVCSEIRDFVSSY